MPIVLTEDNLHELSNPVFWEKYFSMSCWLETLPRVLSVKNPAGQMISMVHLC